MIKRPPATTGMRHVALFTGKFEACEHFYVELLGMAVEWRPDEGNVYLSSGNDNLALHRTRESFNPDRHQRLDHIGFIINRPEQIDEWFNFLKENGVELKTEPRTHRDGARSFYCFDPDGVTVQIIYHPPLVIK